MAIIRNTMEDIKRYIGSNEQTDDARKEEALRALSLFMCPQVAENFALQAVVGFDDNNVPQFWDMTEGNLLATCKTGVAMNYMGCTTVLVSLLLRFTKEEFQYYLFTDEFAPNYLRENESCAGNDSALFDKREVYYSTLEKIFNELNYRKTLSEAELKKQPFLLVVFGNAYRSLPMSLPIPLYRQVSSPLYLVTEYATFLSSISSSPYYFCFLPFSAGGKVSQSAECLIFSLDRHKSMKKIKMVRK